MCYQTRIVKKKTEIKTNFKLDISELDLFECSETIKAFDFPKTPVITNTEPNKAQLFNWGLIPSWTQDTSIRNYTLNARIETLHEKDSFKNNLKNRCLVIADGFYEWKWSNKSGTKKEKHLITLPNDELFAFAGIYDSWKNPNGEIIQSYSIITTEANPLMSTIHNTKKRMPVILKAEDEAAWLQGEDHHYFKYPYTRELSALNLDIDLNQMSFF